MSKKISIYRPRFLKNGKAKDKMPWEFDQNQLLKGIHVELEHTSDVYTAMIIACDHLIEYPKYYDALEKMEKELGISE